MNRKGTARDLARHLASDAEAVCRKYLSNGCREGNYWMIGDVRNTPGHSMHVRLKGAESGRGAAGKWTDEATGEHGDLLDLIQLSCGLAEFREVADEARRFLSLPRPEPECVEGVRSTPDGSQDAARRLFAMAKPLAGTLAERYLHERGILLCECDRALRFHPNCYYRDFVMGRMLIFPALIAAITDPGGQLSGIQRTWLDRNRGGKAPVADQRRSMGSLLGNGIRFGFEPATPIQVLIAGEGLETMLSLRSVMPSMPVIAATSANHLSALSFPAGCERLYIAADADAAGRHGTERLSRRASEAGIMSVVLRPQLGDFNDDLRRFGPVGLAAWLRDQLEPHDARAHLQPPEQRIGTRRADGVVRRRRCSGR
jgi:hypothetical protein